ncbi:hypothetical protein IG193_04290 [Infirmifilum lucidum]|uniref:Uncharacterized protein n=1 Tax=Infirmifilum lucidum TaxID=2776706 RepID=A0A7L9FIT0_9CREN|nr:hypothetical protein [Infirmifilum lucidum]QOJ79679.1 hypothetical protein IG193_04290 [Infirmifilum lucidum]
MGTTSEEVGRSIMVIITLAVVSVIGYFIYTVASATTSRPVIVQAGDAILTPAAGGYTVTVWLQNIGTSSADLLNANLTITNYGITTRLLCNPSTLSSGATSTCTATLPSTLQITSAVTGYIVTKYGIYKVSIIRG